MNTPEQRREYWRAEKKRLREDPEYREKQRAYMHDYVRTPAYRERRNARKKADWQHHLYVAVKSSAKRRGIPFSIEERDIPWVDVCPIFGIPIGPRTGRSPADDCASIDRADNALGYVPGNVVVVSYRANRIKNDATLAELQSILDFYKGRLDV